MWCYFYFFLSQHDIMARKKELNIFIQSTPSKVDKPGMNSDSPLMEVIHIKGIHQEIIDCINHVLQKVV